MLFRSESVEFIMSKLMKYPLDDEACMKIVSLDECIVQENFLLYDSDDEEWNAIDTKDEDKNTFTKPDLLVRSDNPTPPSIEKPPKLELKPLLTHLRYAFLGENNILPIIISNKLNVEQEIRVCEVVRG